MFDVVLHSRQQILYRIVKTLYVFVVAEAVVVDLVAAGADPGKTVVRKRVGIDMAVIPRSCNGEITIRKGQVVIAASPCDLAVIAAFETLRVGIANIARKEVERHPYAALIVFIKVVAIEQMMNGGFRINTRAVLEIHVDLRNVVVDKLRCSRDFLGCFLSNARRAGQSIGSVVVHVDLHRSVLSYLCRVPF